MLVHFNKLLYCVFAIAVASVARVTLRFPSKERGMRVKDRAFFSSRSFFLQPNPRNPFLSRSFVFLCSKTTRKRLLLRQLLLINPFVISYFLTTAVKSETGTFIYEKPFLAVLRRVLEKKFFKCYSGCVSFYLGGARSKGFATLRNVSKLPFFDKIGHAKSVGFRFYSAF